jgi:type I site-specific restriction endonuclease
MNSRKAGATHFSGHTENGRQLITTDKRALTERDICSKFITPAIVRAGWDDLLQIREQVHFTKGRIIVRGKLVTRGKDKFADYVLFIKPNIPLAVIEAKDNNHSVGDGMQQALGYADSLRTPFVFSSNGDGFVFHDRTKPVGVTERRTIQRDLITLYEACLLDIGKMSESSANGDNGDYEIVYPREEERRPSVTRRRSRRAE